LEGSRDIFGGLEDKKGFSTFTKLHWQVLLDVVDPELDLNLLSARPKEPQVWYAHLLLGRPKQLELAKADVKG
jgi:hypothetical protein